MMSGRAECASDVAAGRHVQGMPLLSPLGVINMLSPSSFQLNVNGARAKTDV